MSLVSSLGAALLTGRHQPVDNSDASGTLLMDIRTRTWAPSMLTCGVMPPELEQRLGRVHVTSCAEELDVALGLDPLRGPLVVRRRAAVELAAPDAEVGGAVAGS